MTLLLKIKYEETPPSNTTTWTFDPLGGVFVNLVYSIFL
jgi:hypothetical protein